MDRHDKFDRRDSFDHERNSRRSSMADESNGKGAGNVGGWSRSNSLQNGDIEHGNVGDSGGFHGMHSGTHRRPSDSAPFFSQSRGRFPSESNSFSPYHSSPGTAHAGTGHHVMSPVMQKHGPFVPKTTQPPQQQQQQQQQLKQQPQHILPSELPRRNSEQFPEPKLNPARIGIPPNPQSVVPPTPAPTHSSSSVAMSNHFATAKISGRLRSRKRKPVTVWDGQIVLGEQDKFALKAQMLHYGGSQVNRIPLQSLRFHSRIPTSVAADIFKTLNHKLKRFCHETHIGGDTFLHGYWIVLPARLDGQYFFRRLARALILEGSTNQNVAF